MHTCTTFQIELFWLLSSTKFNLNSNFLEFSIVSFCFLFCFNWQIYSSWILISIFLFYFFFFIIPTKMNVLFPCHVLKKSNQIPKHFISNWKHSFDRFNIRTNKNSYQFEWNVQLLMDRITTKKIIMKNNVSCLWHSIPFLPTTTPH